VKVEVVSAPFNAYQLLDKLNERIVIGAYGAACHFVGTMRDFNLGDDVSSMTLEHYPGMTEKQLQRIVDEALKKWDIIDATIVHRVGEIKPGEAIVLCVIWSAHRDDAFEACRYLIEALKKDAPFWKKEQLPHGERWVDG